MDKVGCTQAPFQCSNNNYALWLINGLPLDPISKSNCAQEQEEQLWPLKYLFSLFVCFNMADVQEKNRNRKEGVPQTAGCVQSEPRVSGK